MTPVGLWLHVATVAAIAALLGWLWAHASARPMRAATLMSVGAVAWLAVTAVLSLSGFAQRVDILPPGAAAVLLPAMLAVAVVLVFLGRADYRSVLHGMPLPALHLAQVFRVPVEVVLAMLVDAGRLPALLSWHGTNFDILTGLTAPLAAWAAVRKMRGSLIVWNLLGLGLVLNVLVTGILASPPPLQVIRVEPSSVFMMSFPLVWLPGFLVPVAILLHGLALLRLLRSG